MYADFKPDFNATVVEKFYEAGAVMLGKLAMTEFALSGYHPSMQPPVNPWSAEHWPGASSSGSGVATAACLCFGSLGSDTGGSIRFPSAACGIVGVKPTYGKVSRYGVFPLGESLDHVGPMTRSVADAAAILRTIAGFDPNDPTTRRETVRDYMDTVYNGVQGLQIGVDEAYCTKGVDPVVRSAVLATVDVFRDLGAEIHEVDVSQINDATPLWYAMCAAEAAAAHSETFPSRADEYGPTFRAFLEDGVKVTGAHYVKAHVARQYTRRLIDETLQKVDMLLCPAMATPPMAIKDFSPQAVLPPDNIPSLLAFTAPMDFSGSPTVNLPCGFTDDGLPLSVQLVGRHGEEGTIMQAAYAYEQATEWHTRQPEV